METHLDYMLQFFGIVALLLGVVVPAFVAFVDALVDAIIVGFWNESKSIVA